jgi:hypothetical protein
MLIGRVISGQVCSSRICISYMKSSNNWTIKGLDNPHDVRNYMAVMFPNKLNILRGIRIDKIRVSFSLRTLQFKATKYKENNSTCTMSDLLRKYQLQTEKL